MLDAFLRLPHLKVELAGYIGNLTVALDRLSRWYRPGPICIGDPTHAMSPIGGVGINLAVQDAGRRQCPR